MPRPRQKRVRCGGRQDTCRPSRRGVCLLTSAPTFSTSERFCMRRCPAVAPAPVNFQRLTDFVGMEQSPSISPDGKAVAFSAGENVPHVWVRLLAGGPPLKITRDDAAHLFPRWAPDSASLIYFSPSPQNDVEGTIYEIPALGGTPR